MEHEQEQLQKNTVDDIDHEDVSSVLTLLLLNLARRMVHNWFNFIYWALQTISYNYCEIQMSQYNEAKIKEVTEIRCNQNKFYSTLMFVLCQIHGRSSAAQVK